MQMLIKYEFLETFKALKFVMQEIWDTLKLPVI